MIISLPPELEAFAQEQVAAGKYASIEDVLADAILALMEREETYQGRFAELRREIQLGAEALDRGESQDLDTAIANIREKMRQRHATS